MTGGTVDQACNLIRVQVVCQVVDERRSWRVAIGQINHKTIGKAYLSCPLSYEPGIPPAVVADYHTLASKVLCPDVRGDIRIPHIVANGLHDPLRSRLGEIHSPTPSYSRGAEPCVFPAINLLQEPWRVFVSNENRIHRPKAEPVQSLYHIACLDHTKRHIPVSGQLRSPSRVVAQALQQWENLRFDVSVERGKHRLPQVLLGHSNGMLSQLPHLGQQILVHQLAAF